MKREKKKKAYSIEIISYYTGYIIFIISSLMIIPAVVSLFFREWSAMLDFVISSSISFIFGLALTMFGLRTRESKSNVHWKHGFAVAAFSWLVLTVLCAIPYSLSGHTQSFLDACFDVMSGFTTTGLVLLQDLDHISNGLNMWRHMLTFIGGQGMIVLGLTFLVKETGGAYKMYVAEGKDIELLPNVKGTARQIWKISIVYLVIGTVVLWIIGMIIGLNPISALFHGFYIFQSAWSTGGFAPNSQNIMYYHSIMYETVSMILFILGSLNFGLHYAIWQGKRKEVVKNIETQSFFITSFTVCILALAGLSRLHIYPDAVAGFRRIIFNVLSAHTTTGFGAVYARQFINEWGDFGVLIMVIAMLIGGSACSTAGGFKGLRVGIVFKGLIMDVKKLLTSERNMKVYKFHYIKERVLDDVLIKSSAIIIICYIVIFSIGTLLGTYYGYSLSDSAFEAASVTGNVGLSGGVTTPSMPVLLKVYYIIAMYLGRLEFLTVFALIGYIIGGIKKYVKNR
ncbi:TrkH family potassium uptake protein [Anaerosacchariphilus polymeriproducens]|uniref:TrkH family potassium uptake protein n=1 Tax=Anaerosacchariphilus polymeriproducens TaxID=1812858 RepID=A0A371AYV1_9FIRM|nr:TrkH family potassium uptake protein [Anaerosacchariphilus polymeriproducens]RDU24733.1 TrkH family potassium uptake protein [Anaerosacchariphilus polymeriproducens]